jgi:hypothetical protein
MDEKKRIVIMNKVHILEKFDLDGKWKTEAVQPAPGSLKAGIYNLNSAKLPEESKIYQGQIIHKDDKYVYHKTSSGLIKHDVKKFVKSPSLGDDVQISQNSNMLSVVNIQKNQKTLKR